MKLVVLLYLSSGFAIFLANLKGIIQFDIFPINIQPFINLPVIHTQPAQNLVSQYSILAPFGIRNKSFYDFNARVSSQTFWKVYINLSMAIDQNLVVFIDKKGTVFKLKRNYVRRYSILQMDLFKQLSHHTM